MGRNGPRYRWAGCLPRPSELLWELGRPRGAVQPAAPRNPTRGQRRNKGKYDKKNKSNHISKFLPRAGRFDEHCRMFNSHNPRNNFEISNKTSKLKHVRLPETTQNGQSLNSREAVSNVSVKYVPNIG